MKHNNIPIFIPELACPNRCVFCNQHKITNKKIIKPQEINNIIKKYLSTIPQENHIEIAFFGGNFTGIPFDLQEDYLKIANYYVENDRVKGIRISTRPDYINTKILDLLKKYNVKAIELGAQSTDDEVLKQSGRGHTFQDIEKASKLIKAYNFELGLQMMIGLPGDSLQKSLRTTNDIVNLKAETTRIYPTLVIKGTQLEKLFLEKKYFPLSINEAVRWTKEIYKIFITNSVKVIRIGLHHSEEFEEGKSLIAGPYHKSFKELVMTELWFERLSQMDFSTTEENIVKVNKKDFNFVTGYQRKNIKHFEKLGIKIKFITD